MARISYIEEAAHPELAELTGRLRAGRRGNLINVYKLLLHAPDLAEAWFELFNAVRWRTTLPGRLREIVVIRIAHLHDMAYVLRQHVPRLAAAEGLAEDECAALADWEGAGFFDDRERAALACADEMVRRGAVSDAGFEAMRRHFDERGAVELTALIGAYIMHNRVFASLRIDLEPPSP